MQRTTDPIPALRVAASPRHAAPPPSLGPSPCHEPSDQGWCAYCEPRAVLARMQAAFPFPIQVAGRVVG